jgi:hypothetical protein
MHGGVNPIIALRNLNPEVSGVRELPRNVQVFLGAIVLPADRRRRWLIEGGDIRYLEYILLYEAVRGVRSTRIL